MPQLATSKMFLDITYHNRAHEGEKMVNNSANAEGEKTLLGTMCKLCVICFVEAIKIIGKTLNQHFVQGSTPMPHRLWFDYVFFPKHFTLPVY